MNKTLYETFKFLGINRDIEPVDLMNGSPPVRGAPTPAVWTAGLNVHFDDNSTHRVDGYKTFAFTPLPTVKPVYALNVLSATDAYWIWCGSDGVVYVYDGTKHIDISKDVFNSDPEFDNPSLWITVDEASITGGRLVFDSSGLGGYCGQDVDNLVAGDTYKIGVEVSDIAAGTTVVLTFGATVIDITTAGMHYFDVVANTDIQTLSLQIGPSDTRATIEALTVYTGELLATDGEWTGCVLNGVPVLNNGKQPPFWWNGDISNPIQTLPDWPVDTLCGAIAAFKYNLIAMDITTASVRTQEHMLWSDAADPGQVPDSWTAGPDNQAGSNILADTAGAIIDGKALRDSFILYKNHSTYVMDYVGGQFVFSFRLLFNNSGIQSRNCVVELRGKHWVLTDTDLIAHDGNTYKSIADKEVREFALSFINPDNYTLSIVVAQPVSDEVWFCIPSLDDAKLNYALVYSYPDGYWGIRKLPDVVYIASGILPNEDDPSDWDSASISWEQELRFWNQASYSLTQPELLMLGDEFFVVDGAHDEDGTPLEAFVERTDWTIGGVDDVWINKLIRSVYPVITGRVGDVVRIRVAASQQAKLPIDWGAPIDYVIGSNPVDEARVDIFSHGRFLNIRIESTGGFPWELHRMAVEYSRLGKY